MPADKICKTVHQYSKEPVSEEDDFFARANSSAFEEKLSFAVDVLKKADLIIFTGMGSSGTLAKYGARYFSNMGPHVRIPRSA